MELYIINLHAQICIIELLKKLTFIIQRIILEANLSYLCACPYNCSEYCMKEILKVA